MEMHVWLMLVVAGLPACSVAEVLESLEAASCPNDWSQEVTALLVSVATAAAAVDAAAEEPGVGGAAAGTGGGAVRQAGLYS